MRPPSRVILRRLGSLLLVGLVLMACNLASVSTSSSANVTNQPSSTATQLSGQAEPTATVGAASAETDPLDRLLTMRSIKFNLTSQKSDGTSDTMDVEIDSAGNMHVKHSLPAPNPDDLPEGFDTTKLPTSYEMYVVDGKAYTPSDENPNWMASPVDEKYLQTLSGEMHGPFSPAIWLDLLPLGSINAAGKDTVGGFAADKYNVNGQVAGQSITGTIWFEPLADALVQAELHVPAALLSDPSEPQQGELKIMLNAQKADIPLVSLPGASENKAGASPTLAPASSSSSSSKPTIANTYAVQTILPATGGNKGGGPGSAMLVLPGQVWTGSMFGGLQQWDPQTGKVVKTFPEVASKIFFDMKFDGKNLWVLTNDKFLDTFPDTLYVISLPEGDIVKKFEIKSNKLLTQIGSSPGKMWVASTIYDTETLLANPVSKGLPDETHYAFDGEQWMWITGTNCHMCGHDLWLYDANNLPDHKDKLNSGTLDDGVLGSRMVLADGKIWLVVRPNGDPIYILDAYDIHKSDQPVLQVDLTKEFKETDSQSSDVYLATDNHVGWLSMVGKLYYFDLKTGQILGSLPIGEHVMGMGFDGHSLWVLSNDDGLIQVSLPW